MERSNEVPVERSVCTRGGRNRCHKMIHNGINAENPLVNNTFGKEHGDVSLTQEILDHHIPSKKLTCWEVDDFENKTFKVPQWKPNILGTLTAWLAPPWVSKDVWGVTGFAVSSDESPEKCELTGSSTRDVNEKWTASFDWRWNQQEQNVALAERKTVSKSETSKLRFFVSTV